MGRKSHAKKELIQAGKWLFHKFGYQSVSISQLCEYASVRSGTFFHFFESKEAFLQIVLDQSWAEFDTYLLQTLEDNENTPIQRIYNFLDACYYYIKSQPNEFDVVVGCPFGNLINEVVPQEPNIQRRLGQAVREVSFLLEQILRLAIRAGELEDPDPHETSLMIVAGLEGIWMMAKVYNDPEIVKRLLGKLSRLLVLGENSDIEELKKSVTFL